MPIIKNPRIINHEIVAICEFEPVRVERFEVAYEADRVRVELTYFGPEDEMYEEGDDIGWFVSVDVKGWGLTKAGKRFKNQTKRENLYMVGKGEWPATVLVAAQEAFGHACAKGHIDPATVLRNNGTAGDTLTLL